MHAEPPITISDLVHYGVLCGTATPVIYRIAEARYPQLTVEEVKARVDAEAEFWREVYGAYTKDRHAAATDDPRWDALRAATLPAMATWTMADPLGIDWSW